MDTLLARFAPIIAATSSTDITTDPTLGGRLVLDAAGPLSVTYAPFDHVNPDARVVLVGITPGRQQAVQALLEARRHLMSGRALEDVAKAAKETASFAGPMRTSLVDMLDHIGLQRWLGIGSTAELFGRRADLVHYTSALRYPVYLNGDNYSGSPNMIRQPLLRRSIETYLAAEVRALPRAVWIPLGPAPASALALLAAEGHLDPRQILDGLPHPSGANGERIAYFLGRKSRDTLSAKTNAEKLDTARERLCGLVARLAA
jgi:hypothetical protein